MRKTKAKPRDKDNPTLIRVRVRRATLDAALKGRGVVPNTGHREEAVKTLTKSAWKYVTDGVDNMAKHLEDTN